MQPIKDRSDATKRAKRLAKSLRRRREYVQNLRQSARQEREHGDPIHAAFAIMLDDLAERELELARNEQNEAHVVDVYLHGSKDTFSHAGMTQEDYRAMQEKHVEIMKRLDGRLSSDRVKYLAGHLDVGNDLVLIEKALGLDRGDSLYMKRLEAAEIAAFGAIRFQ